MYTVGQFSKICDVSVKALHHYDEIHLVKPLHIDPATGYRYYDYDQIKILKYIGKLKRFGFTLQEIKEIIQDQSELDLENRLRGKAVQLEKKIVKMQQTLKEINRSIHDVNQNQPFLSVSNITDCFEEQRERQLIYGIREMTSIREIDFVVKNYLKGYMHTV